MEKERLAAAARLAAKRDMSLKNSFVFFLCVFDFDLMNFIETLFCFFVCRFVPEPKDIERLAMRWRDKSIAINNAIDNNDDDDDDNNDGDDDNRVASLNSSSQSLFITPFLSRTRPRQT